MLKKCKSIFYHVNKHRVNVSSVERETIPRININDVGDNIAKLN